MAYRIFRAAAVVACLAFTVFFAAIASEGRIAPFIASFAVIGSMFFLALMGLFMEVK